MRKILPIALTLIMLSLVAGCAQLTDVLYGPDVSSDQLKTYIYEDSYAIGAIFGRDKTTETIAKLISDAELNPYGLITHQFYEALASSNTNDAILYFALIRIYRRLGLDPTADILDLSGLNYELLKLASDGYLDGLKSRL